MLFRFPCPCQVEDSDLSECYHLTVAFLTYIFSLIFSSFPSSSLGTQKFLKSFISPCLCQGRRFRFIGMLPPDGIIRSIFYILYPVFVSGRRFRFIGKYTTSRSIFYILYYFISSSISLLLKFELSIFEETKSIILSI